MAEADGSKGGVSTRQYFVFRDRDSFFRNEFGQKDLHLLLRFVCIVIGAASSGVALFVFFLQATGQMSLQVDALPYFYNGLFFMLSAIGDSALSEYRDSKGVKKKK